MGLLLLLNRRRLSCQSACNCCWACCWACWFIIIWLVNVVRASINAWLAIAFLQVLDEDHVQLVVHSCRRWLQTQPEQSPRWQRQPYIDTLTTEFRLRRKNGYGSKLANSLAQKNQIVSSNKRINHGSWSVISPSRPISKTSKSTSPWGSLGKLLSCSESVCSIGPDWDAVTFFSFEDKSSSKSLVEMSDSSSFSVDFSITASLRLASTCCNCRPMVSRHVVRGIRPAPPAAFAFQRISFKLVFASSFHEPLHSLAFQAVSSP